MYLPDTHTLVWYFTADARLSAKARNLLQSAETKKETIVSPIIILAEMEGVFQKLRLMNRFTDILREMRSRGYFLFYPLTEEIFDLYMTLDPSINIHDRLIIATAKLTKSILITKDATIIQSKEVPTLW